MLLPNDIKDLILEYHDEFDLINKKQKLHYIIKAGYDRFMLNYCRDNVWFEHDFEYQAKLAIFPFFYDTLMISDLIWWDDFMKSFKRYDILINNLCLLPNYYLLI